MVPTTVKGTGSGKLLDRSILVIEAIVGIVVVGAIVGRAYGLPSTLVFLSCGLAAAFSGYALIKMVGSLTDDSLEITGRVRDEERERLEHEKFLVLQEIKELEADAGVGKVDADNYNHLRKTAEARALDIIHQLRKSDDHWMREAERLVAKRLGRSFGPTEAKATQGTAAWAAEDKAAREKRAPIAELFDHRPVYMSSQAGAELISCSACETQNEQDARYCIGCGRPREETS